MSGKLKARYWELGVLAFGAVIGATANQTVPAVYDWLVRDRSLHVSVQRSATQEGVPHV